MKVKFLKDHLNNSKGDVVEVTDEQSHYFERTGVAKEHKAKKNEADDKEKVEETTVKEKRETTHTPKHKTTGIPKA